MNIRSLTVGAALPQNEEARADLIGRLGNFAQAGRAALESSGLNVQTLRFAAQPLEQWIGPFSEGEKTVSTFGECCERAGLTFCSLGTIQAAHHISDDTARLLQAVPDLLIAAENVFASVQVGMREGDSGTEVLNGQAITASATIIKTLSERTPDGFGNMRFAAAANCPPHVPFFPAAYYEEDEKNGGRPEFGLALEAADLAVRAFSDTRTPGEARSNLLALLADEGGRAAEACAAIAADHGYTFTGLDISMAPYPTPDRSIARAIEMISGVPFGSTGTLAAAAFVTGTLKEARSLIPTVGYSGLMLPVLEDQTLADRAAEGRVTLETLLLLSSVCGLGLDTIPLPGDITPGELERIIGDMAALAVRLDKPLTARLLPVPGKSAGDAAEWPDFHYFTKGRIMGIA